MIIGERFRADAQIALFLYNGAGFSRHSWIKPFEILSASKKTEILKGLENNAVAGLPVLGGIWKTLAKMGCRKRKVYSWMLLTTEMLYSGVNGEICVIPLILIKSAQLEIESARHISNRGYYGARYLKIEVYDTNTINNEVPSIIVNRLPIKGGGAAQGMIAVISGIIGGIC